VVSVGISQIDIIDFQTLDDQPVRLLFMIAAAYNQHAYYLQTLSFFSAKLKDKDLRQALMAVKTPQEAYAILVGQKA
jgi:PTS system nitrogen regulatory IIA component